MGKRYWECFLEHSELWKAKSVALYGTGAIAAEILEKCKHIHIAGVYDRDLRSGMLCDVRILNIRDIRKDGIEAIVIAAQPENVYAIYKRIANTAIGANVELYNIYGEDLVALYGEQEHGFGPEDHCFEQDADRLVEWIRSHDVISFDIFDTLVMRKVYEPHDVFYLVQDLADKRGIKADGFYADRIQAEINLIRRIPTLAEIYDEFQRLTKVSDRVREELSRIETEIERLVIVPREKMVDIFHKAIDMKKRVYLISDMYLPTALLEEILEQNGITGYVKLYNSCDFHRPKVDGLFEIFTGQVEGKRYLHIGDHAQADGECANRAGMDSYVIKKGSEICEASMFQDVGLNIRTWNEKLLYGFFVSRLFNDPFCVGADGRIIVRRVADLAFCGAAPTAAAFAEWLRVIREKEGRKILFGARDGWLFQKMLEEKYPDIGIYFYTSRLACLHCRTSLEKKENYTRYLSETGVAETGEYLFFDLASSGTCLAELADRFGLDLKGVFLYRYDCGNKDRRHLQILSYFPEDSNSMFWKNYKFFEMVLTSPEPSLKEFDKMGRPVFEEEYRSASEMECTLELQEAVKDFYDMYGLFCDDSPVSTEFLDGTMSVLEGNRICVKDRRVKELCIYDSYGEGRIRIMEGLDGIVIVP